MVVEGDWLYPPELLPLDLAALFSRDPLARLLRPLEHVGEHVRVEGALVEGGLAPAVEGGDYGRADVYEARGGPHVVAAGGGGPEPQGGGGGGSKKGPRHPVPVPEVADVVRLEGAGGRARAEEAPAEAGALLVGPVNEA